MIRKVKLVTGMRLFWADNDVAYVVSGKGDRSKVNDVAVAAYEQIDSRRAPAKTGG